MQQHLPNRTFIIVILGALSTLSPLAIDMYLPAFNGIATALHTVPTRISLSISAYFVGIAAGQLFYGPLLDRFGRKKPLYFGLLLFVAASLCCMRTHSVYELVVFRFIQALGGCAASVAAMAMVRDFFPVQDCAKIISLLILILGVSPLLAPSIGSLVADNLGWQWVFIVLSAFALFLVAIIFFKLPEGHQPDRTISLHPVPIFKNFAEILVYPQFYTFALAGAFSFAGLLVYVSSASVVFMNYYQMTSRQFSFTFAGLAVGFIGSNQVNIQLLRRFTSAQIFRGALFFECFITLLHLIGVYCDWFNLAVILVLMFMLLSCLGLAFPNAAALALTPFEKNAGSASALLGFVQIGAASLASACVGLFNSKTMLPMLVTFAATSWVALAIYIVGRRYVATEDSSPKNETASVIH